MKIELEKLKPQLIELYGNDKSELKYQLRRYSELVVKHKIRFKNDEIYLFSTSGRIEIVGNHTDHNFGKVVAAGIDLDTIAAVSKNNRNEIKIFSEGFEKSFNVKLNKLNVVSKEKGTTNSLIRGVAKGLIDKGFKIGGFDASISSNVLLGSGLSSSASVEVLIGTILNKLYNNSKVNAKTLAIVGQFAENEYFGKPCGLMDQMAVAVGGMIEIDFKIPTNPKVKKIKFDFNKTGYSIAVVNTGGSHADLTEDYAAIPKEMKCVAKALNKNVCRELTYNMLIKNLNKVRQKCSDRAILRAVHFLEENKRVTKVAKYLAKNNFNEFLNLINDSGNSSFKYLQNIYSNKNFTEQGISLALAITEKFIKEIGEGACRVHGGGFAGTILAFIPKDKFAKYRKIMESIFGKNSVSKLDIRTRETAFLYKF